MLCLVPKSVAVLAWTFLLLFGAAAAASSSVIELNDSNFKSKVLKDDGVWMVEFYAPWCGHCKNLAPEWEKAAAALKGIVNVAAVDATQQNSLAQKYKIQGFPTIKIFGQDKSKPSDYQGARQARAIVEEGLRAASTLAKARLSGGGGGGKREKEKRERKKSSSSSSSDVRTLTDENFEELVYNSKDLWMVEFYAPWCGHCKALAPEWEEAARETKGSVKFGAVDATVETNLANKFGIRGYPTIKVFAPGSKRESDAEEYQGPRKADGIVSYALERLEREGGPAASWGGEITSQKAFEDFCTGTKKSCVIAFLPHILDTGKTVRDSNLKMLEDLASQQRRAPFLFAWAQGGAQERVEKTLGLSFGFPAVVAINAEKKRAAIQRGPFSSEGIGKFLISLTTGKVRAEPFQGELKWETVQPWDGTEPEREEEESLEDILGEDWRADL